MNHKHSDIDMFNIPTLDFFFLSVCTGAVFLDAPEFCICCLPVNYSGATSMGGVVEMSITSTALLSVSCIKEDSSTEVSLH